ncbi:alkaline phosphatase family protein, partial [bacterium]|nr:alkaline phosphatase family protein [bacterium]
KVKEMKRNVVLIVLPLAGLPLLPAMTEGHKDRKPRLANLIGIDQFRASYLREYDRAFAHGFRRLLDKGFRFDPAVVDHAATLSFNGHATLHGEAIKTGISNEHARTIDVAPTLATLAGISFPDSVDDKALQIPSHSTPEKRREK